MIYRDYDRGLVASPTRLGGLLRVLRFPPPAEATEPGEGVSRANQEGLKVPSGQLPKSTLPPYTIPILLLLLRRSRKSLRLS